MDGGDQPCQPGDRSVACSAIGVSTSPARAVLAPPLRAVNNTSDDARVATRAVHKVVGTDVSIYLATARVTVQLRTPAHCAVHRTRAQRTRATLSPPIDLLGRYPASPDVPHRLLRSHRRRRDGTHRRTRRTRRCSEGDTPLGAQAFGALARPYRLAVPVDRLGPATTSSPSASRTPPGSPAQPELSDSVVPHPRLSRQWLTPRNGKSFSKSKARSAA